MAKPTLYIYGLSERGIHVPNVQKERCTFGASLLALREITEPSGTKGFKRHSLCIDSECKERRLLSNLFQVCAHVASGAFQAGVWVRVQL